MEKKNYKRYTITAALPYANGPLHIGHIAGAYLPADIYVRYLRMKGEDVAFICGSDEHGAAITLRAKKEDITPQQIVDKYNTIIKDSFEKFGISFNIYHRTSYPLHHETSQEFFKKLYETGKFIEKSSEQFYDEQFNQFLADRYIIGTCPKCSYENAYGDQCEKCGTSLSPTDLINPKSTLSGKTPILKGTRHWYLPMQDYQKWLEEWIVAEKKDLWKTNVYGQCKAWLDQGLHERAMTRDLDWGVKVPLPDTDGKVLYVWLDAPIGYISATKEWAKENNKNWEDYWKSEDTRLIHFIGKDNIVFHCIIFPIILKAHGDFILPDNVPANEFLNLEGNKISTSRNWAVWVDEYMRDFPEKQDYLRYVLTSISPETKDSEFTWKDFQSRVNNELVATLGNFINRTLVLTNKYYENQVPAPNAFAAYDQETLDKLKVHADAVERLVEDFKFRDALQEIMEVARMGNKYLADTQPWKIYASDPEIVQTIMYVALQITANLCILLKPFLPFSAAKIQKMLNISEESGLLEWQNVGKKEIISPAHIIGNAELLFAKVEDSEVEAQIQKLQASKLTNTPTEPLKPNVSYEGFSTMDIRIATIIEAEKVAKTKKLLKLKVDTGIDKRTVVSGIGEYYTPEQVIGKQVCLLANLEPREIKGIKSEGMILMAEDKDGKLVLVSPTQNVWSGSVVK